MDVLQTVLDRIDREVRSRLGVRAYETTAYGDGFNCCGCASYDEIVEAIERIIREEQASAKQRV